ncbi:hypothetical protein, partial [Bordetella pertussis]|uniref:hypothetical protein n=1 Tax=Bordetella pertussis TaxID=520 RepID=UPI00366EB40B
MAEMAPAPGENEIAHDATKKVNHVESVMRWLLSMPRERDYLPNNTPRVPLPMGRLRAGAGARVAPVSPGARPWGRPA